LTTKVYIDTNIVSHLSDSMPGTSAPISNENAQCLLDICSADVELVTSKEMLDEMLQCIDLKKKAVLSLMATLAEKVPYQDITFLQPTPWGSSQWGATMWGGGKMTIDPVLVQLQAIFKGSNDPRHIFQASKGGCSYFLTLDNRTIVKSAKSKKDELEIICPGQQFVLPCELSQLLKSF